MGFGEVSGFLGLKALGILDVIRWRSEEEKEEERKEADGREMVPLFMLET